MIVAPCLSSTRVSRMSSPLGSKSLASGSTVTGAPARTVTWSCTATGGTLDATTLMIRLPWYAWPIASETCTSTTLLPVTVPPSRNSMVPSGRNRTSSSGSAVLAFDRNMSSPSGSVK